MRLYKASFRWSLLVGLGLAGLSACGGDAGGNRDGGNEDGDPPAPECPAPEVTCGDRCCTPEEAVELPIEVLGPEGTEESRTFELADASAATTIYLQCFRCGYHDDALDADPALT